MYRFWYLAVIICSLASLISAALQRPSTSISLLLAAIIFAGIGGFFKSKGV